MDQRSEFRPLAITESIKATSVEELKASAAEFLQQHDDMWREMFFCFITKQSGATFHPMTIHDNVPVNLLPRSGEWPLVPPGKRQVRAGGATYPKGQ